jgi:uncharacterized integral membrane protein
MQTVRWIIAATVFIVLLFVALQNADAVTLRFFNLVSIQAPLVFVVLVTFAAGVAAGLLAGALRASRLKRQLNKLRREQRQAGALPSQPVPDNVVAAGAGHPRHVRLSDGL